MPPRVAYSVSKKIGSSVTRNRLRRRVRSAVADLGDVLRPGAYLLIPARDALQLSYDELRAVIAGAVKAVVES
jgi:ribonuclease P protein component